MLDIEDDERLDASSATMDISRQSTSSFASSMTSEDQTDSRHQLASTTQSQVFTATTMAVSTSSAMSLQTHCFLLIGYHVNLPCIVLFSTNFFGRLRNHWCSEFPVGQTSVSIVMSRVLKWRHLNQPCTSNYLYWLSSPSPQPVLSCMVARFVFFLHPVIQTR